MSNAIEAIAEAVEAAAPEPAESEHVQAVKAAWGAVAAAREVEAEAGTTDSPSPAFRDALAAFLAACKASVLYAPVDVLWRLRRVIDATDQLAEVRSRIREVAVGNFGVERWHSSSFWSSADGVDDAVRGLEFPEVAPSVDSPRTLKAMGAPLHVIHNSWKHLSTAEVAAIVGPETEDPKHPDPDPATHPTTVAWHRERRRRPALRTTKLLIETSILEAEAIEAAAG